MNRYDIEVVENATNASNILPETPLEKVVADCMTDYLEMRKAEEQGLLLRLPCKVGSKVYVIAPNYNKCENHYECDDYDADRFLITWCQNYCVKGFSGIGIIECLITRIEVRENDIYFQTDKCGMRNIENFFLTS